MFRSLTFAAALAMNCLLLTTAAHAQDISLRPTYGSIRLQAGFNNDPRVYTLVAGGTVRTNKGGIGAFVAKAPDFKLYYKAGILPLTFHVESKGDTTLLINLPNGTWIASDDVNGLNPLIKLNAPMSGRYDIYVGTIRRNPVRAVLKITELK